MRKRAIPLYAVVLLTCLMATSFVAFADTVPRMTVDQLKLRLGAEDVVILDVRSGRDWDAAKTLISGAVRVRPNEVSQWAESVSKEKSIILYCA
jgi:rhodanese-related sulfurtransferase